MNKNIPKILTTCVCVSMLAGLTGCTTSKTENIDAANDQAGAVMSLDFRDFEKAAVEAITSMLESPALRKPDGGQYILAISRIINDTMQHFDTDLVIKKIRVQLLNSGRVQVTTTVSGQGAEDALPTDARNLRTNDEFDQKNVPGKNKMVAPELSLSGKFIQRNVKMDNGDIQVEYYFQLTISRISTGLSIWEGETFIGKRGDKDNATW